MEVAPHNMQSECALRDTQMKFKTFPVPQIGVVRSSLKESQYVPYDKLSELVLYFYYC